MKPEAASVEPLAIEPQRGPVLRGHIHILPDSPLPELNTSGAAAFAVSGPDGIGSTCYALVCHPNSIPRTDTLQSLKNMKHSSLLHLVEHGATAWPDEANRRYSFIYERPPGKPAFASLNATRAPMTEDQLVRQVLHPAISALRELKGRAVFHGAINPTNLYFRAGTSGPCILGEYLTMPAGSNQPVLFEPVERAMAQPDARGSGTVSDDLYALGITLLFFLLGGNPASGLSDDAIIQEKIERGSYHFLVGSHLIPTGLMELLRGMLADDPRMRWTLKDIDAWEHGQRHAPKQPSPLKRASRPLQFAGKPYRECRSLAMALAKQRPAALQIIESGELDRWLRRSLGDEDKAEQVFTATKSTPSSGSNSEDRTIARACITLDPAAPIRYKGLSIRIEGLATALAAQLKRGESGQELAEMLALQLPAFWASAQADSKGEYAHHLQVLDSLRPLLERSSFGFGLERVAYEANPTLPCLSPLLKGAYATSTAELLARLNIIAPGIQEQFPIDRHIAAFILSQNRRMDERLFHLLSPNTEPQRRAIATLTIFAELQRRHGPAELPGLAALLASRLEPAIQAFHSRSVQKEIRADIARTAATGNLSLLLRVVDDNETFQKDEDDFIAARHVYNQINREMAVLTRRAADKSSAALNIGRNVAAICAGIIASIIVVTVVLMRMLG